MIGLDLTTWIDVHPSDGNISDKNVKIYDRRESRVVKTFDEVHSSKTLFAFNNNF